MSSYRIITLIIRSSQNSVFHFCFSLHNTFGSKNSCEIYKTSKISSGAIIKSPETLKFVIGQLNAKMKHKTLKMKKISFAIMFVPDLYKTREMCDKVILEK